MTTIDEQRIEDAIQAASETQPSWKMRCYRILGALGTDFGDNDDPDDFAAALLSDRAAMAERVAGLERHCITLERQRDEANVYGDEEHARADASEAEVARLREALEKIKASDQRGWVRDLAVAALTRPDEPTKET